jgi:hypothetical protein
MADKKQLAESHDKATSTRRDVMKLSLTVAAFGAALGISSPDASASETKHKDKKSRAARAPGEHIKKRPAARESIDVHLKLDRKRN